MPRCSGLVESHPDSVPELENIRVAWAVKGSMDSVVVMRDLIVTIVT